MSTFIKTYIIGAPWRSIIFSGFFFAIIAGGLNLLASYKTTGSFITYGDVIMWFAVGMFVWYTRWRTESYLERKNQRWKAKRKRSSKE